MLLAFFGVLVLLSFGDPPRLPRHTLKQRLADRGDRGFANDKCGRIGGYVSSATQ